MRKQILKDLISDVIAEMCFLYEEVPPEIWEEKYLFFSWIENAEFKVSLLISQETATELTVNFLGIEEFPGFSEIEDTLREILNMAIGRFIAEEFPAHAALLPIPRCKSISSIKDLPFFHPGDTEYLFYGKTPIKVIYQEK